MNFKYTKQAEKALDTIIDRNSKFSDEVADIDGFAIAHNSHNYAISNVLQLLIAESVDDTTGVIKRIISDISAMKLPTMQ